MGLAVAAGLAIRVARLDARPMHHDEANQAIKFGILLEQGEYRYDFTDHHGPTLYYLSLPAAWLRGQRTLASLDEWTLRGVSVVAGVLTILLLSLLSRRLGPTAVVASAWLLALSPAMVFYSRMYIQESLFACFTLALVIAIGAVAQGGGLAWSAAAGVAGGLAIATKETSVIVLAAVLVACAISRWSLRTTMPHLTNGMPRLAIPVALGTALAIAALFYSSFLASPSGLLEPFRGASTYLHRGVAPATHAHPWDYYVRLLAYSSDGGLHWSEAVILVLAAVGALAAWTRIDSAHPERTFWTRYLSATAILMTAIFSAIPYKTPWNVLPFYCVAIVVAGWGVSWLAHVSAARAIRASIAIAVATACANLGWQAWRASVTYAADPRNPYVYAQTVPDAVRMAARIRDLAALDAHGSAMQVSVIASPYEQWPLPWYLRAMPNVGYWLAPGDPLAVQAPVIVSSMDHTAALDAALGDRYVSEFYGLRPGVLLALYVERGLWDRFLARTAERCGEPRPVAM